MKPKNQKSRNWSSLFVPMSACIALPMLATNVLAQDNVNATFAPTGGTANWGDNATWLDGSFPNATDAAVDISGAFSSALVLDVQDTSDVNQNYTLGNLTFKDTASTFRDLTLQNGTLNVSTASGSATWLQNTASAGSQALISFASSLSMAGLAGQSLELRVANNPSVTATDVTGPAFRFNAAGTWTGYLGPIILSKGLYQANGANSMPQLVALTLGSGSDAAYLRINGGQSQTIAALNGNAQSFVHTQSATQAGTLSINSALNGNFAGTVGTNSNGGFANGGINIVKGGAGTQEFSGSIVNMGSTVNTTISVSGGTLFLSVANTYRGTTTINSGGTLKIGTDAALGDTLVVATDLTTVTGSTSAVVADATGLRVGQYIQNGTTGVNNNTTISAITGTTVTLSVAATADGTVTTRFFMPMVVSSGGTFDFNGQTVTKNISALDGTGVGAIGALVNSNTGTPAELGTELKNVGLFTVGGAGDLTLNRVYNTAAVARAITKVGGGTLTLSGSTNNNRYGLNVNGGTVNLNKSGSGEAVINNPLVLTAGTVKLTGTGSNQIHDSDNLEVDGGTFDMNGKSETVGALLAAAAGGTVTNNGASPSVLSVSGTASPGSYAGAIQDGTSALGLTKVGSGSETLTGTLAYSGDTTISAGTLSISSPSLNDASTLNITTATGVLDLAHSGTDVVAAMVVDGSPVANGVYGGSGSGAANIVSYITGTGRIQVGATAGFASWITGTFANGTVPVGKQGANDDPDGDGVSNLVEYAIAGMDPTAGNGPVGALTGKTVTFTKRTPLATDITYVIQESVDLGAPTAWADMVTQTAPGNADPTISFTLSGPSSQDFMRLKVTQN